MTSTSVVHGFGTIGTTVTRSSWTVSPTANIPPSALSLSPKNGHQYRQHGHTNSKLASTAAATTAAGDGGAMDAMSKKGFWNKVRADHIVIPYG